MGTDNLIFLEVIEWFDETGKEVVHRIPESGSGEIKYGAQLIVRESQAAVFFYNGKAYDAFGPGRHTLVTANIPILNKIMSIPWGLTSPLRAEVYLVNLKVFPNLSWGTKEPVAFKDSELGLIRLRAFGIFNLRVVQPVLLINSLVGTQGIFTISDLEDYLSRLIVSRFNDYMGETLDTILNLPGRYDKFADALQQRLADDFSRFGLSLTQLVINAITPPPEVQKAMDDKSRLGLFDNLNDLIRLKTAMALEKASETKSDMGGGLGMAMGMMVPGLFSETLKQTDRHSETITCPDCNRSIAADSRFCPWCGHQVVILQKCPDCGKSLPADARFCLRCGKALAAASSPRTCKSCRTENLPNATFCNACGEKL